jgi:hypothetical protein
VRVLIAGLLCLVAIPAVAGAAGGKDVRAIRAVLQKQGSLIRQGEWRALYALTTPRMRSRCPYPRYRQLMQANRRLLGTNFRIDRIRVRFRASTRAVVAYRVVRPGKQAISVPFSAGDLYAKIGSRWYDEYDAIAC